MNPGATAAPLRCHLSLAQHGPAYLFAGMVGDWPQVF